MTDNPFTPTALADFVFSDDKSKTLLESIVSGRLPFPLMDKKAICLWGSYGTGKTTLAALLPTLLEQSGTLQTTVRGGSPWGGDYWHLTPCGSGANSVSMIGDLNKRIQSGIGYSPTGWHFEILDEVDLLTEGAQQSLKATFTQANETIFILTTNHLPELDKGLLDRSMLVAMNQPKPSAMAEQGRQFLRKMGLTGDEISAIKLEQMAAESRGSIRDFGTAMLIEGRSLGGVLPP